MLRGMISLLFVMGLLLGVMAIMLRVPSVRDTVFPESMLDYLRDQGVLDVIGATEGVATPVVTVEDSLTDSAEGLLASGPVAAIAGNEPVPSDAVISGYSTRSSGAVPAEITTIRPILGCQTTRPMAGTVVGHVTAGQSGMPIGMATYGDGHLALAVQDFVDIYRKLGPDSGITLTGPRFEVYDVAVTETGAPVYLILENRSGNRIWNIHAAEGVRIERVVLLGGDQAGVANLDPVVPVEVILAPGLAECGILPAYPPTPGQIADADPVEGVQPMTPSKIAEAMVLADAYDVWFHDSFGVKAGESRIGFDRGTISAVGPLPDGDLPKPVWSSVDGSRLRTTHDQFLDIDGQVAPGQDFAARVIAIATGFANGDLGLLRQGGSF